jgi:putative FmdB family regulatory protein
MPIYEYRCRRCDYQFERLEKMNQEPLRPRCPRCGRFFGERLPSVAHARFKGTGFYANDYKRRDKNNDRS